MADNTNVRPFFEVIEGGDIEFQPSDYGPGTCGAWPPVEKVSELGEKGLVTKISELEAAGELSPAPDHPSYKNDDYDPETFYDSVPGRWFGGCYSGDAGLDPADDVECTDFEDCDESEVCRENECVGAPDDWSGAKTSEPSMGAVTTSTLATPHKHWIDAAGR